MRRFENYDPSSNNKFDIVEKTVMHNKEGFPCNYCYLQKSLIFRMPYCDECRKMCHNSECNEKLKEDSAKTYCRNCENIYCSDKCFDKKDCDNFSHYCHEHHCGKCHPCIECATENCRKCSIIKEESYFGSECDFNSKEWKKIFGKYHVTEHIDKYKCIDCNKENIKKKIC